MEKIIVWIGITAIIILLFFVAKESIKRQAWLDAHCIVIGEMSGNTSIGMGLSSKGAIPVSTYTQGKTGYSCDDGKTYWE